MASKTRKTLRKQRSVLDTMHDQYVADKALPDAQAFEVRLPPKLVALIERIGKPAVMAMLGAYPEYPESHAQSLESLTLLNYCELCGHGNQHDGYAPLEPAYNSLSQPHTLCRPCRIGCAELLHDRNERIRLALAEIEPRMERWYRGGVEAGQSGVDYDFWTLRLNARHALYPDTASTTPPRKRG